MEWIVLLAAILIGVPAAVWLAQDRLIFFPQPAVSAANLTAQTKPLEVVAADGTRLRGWMRAADAVRAPVVMYFGGNAEEVSGTLVDSRWPRDWTIVAINYRRSSPTRWRYSTRLPRDPTSTPVESLRSAAASAPASQ